VVAISLRDESFVESEKARFGVCPWEAMWYSLIDPERPGKRTSLNSGPSLSNAGALKGYLGKTLSVGSKCTELNPNPPRSSPELRAFVTE